MASLLLRILLHVLRLILDGMDENDAITTAANRFGISQEKIRKYFRPTR